MIKKILLGLAVVLLALAGFIASRPSAFTVQRTVTMKSPPKYIFPNLNSFFRWAEWSPWNDLDPAMKRTYEGPVVGVGNVYAWAGNAQAGEGRMTLEESRKDELVRVKLELFKPFSGTYTTALTLKPVPEGTTVTWTLEGHHGFMGKAASLFMDMEARVGKDFEAGLDRLRMMAEARTVDKAREAATDEAVRKALAEMNPKVTSAPSMQPAQGTPSTRQP
ncbi:MAG TPA: SRPBCC family protein [Hyalangium sp.]|nr:SRPBCC family protein [Hyalangium sp.]